MKKIARKSLGIICIILGFLALVTPLTPGSWLILIGLEILGLGFLLDGKLSRFLKGRNKERFENIMKKFRKKKRSGSCESEQKTNNASPREYKSAGRIPQSRSG